MALRTPFLVSTRTALDDHTFVKLTLGHYTGADDLKKITIKKILIKGAEKLSFTYTHKTRDIVKNYDIEDGLERIERALASEFKTANLFTTEFDIAFDKGKIKKSPASTKEKPSLSHDRAKNRLVAIKPYLHDLGITDANGNVLKSAQDKYRQIDKYVEILSGLIKKPKKIVDMGSGKGYLTFALYDYLSTQNPDTKIIGVEFRKDMVDLCTKIAAKANFKNLSFAQGTIESYDASDADTLIALHACDTATDDAIAKGIAAGAELIVVAPCCHKQIRREMERVKHSDDFLLRHGIFLERQAEMVTDGIRALILEYFGYSVKVFEFIATEHTPKNVLIVATKTGKGRNEALLPKIAAAKNAFRIGRHYLESVIPEAMSN